jgi:hypothetical protein
MLVCCQISMPVYIYTYSYYFKYVTDVHVYRCIHVYTYTNTHIYIAYIHVYIRIFESLYPCHLLYMHVTCFTCMLLAANVFMILKIDYCLGGNAAFLKKIRFGGWGRGGKAIKANTGMFGLSDGKVTSRVTSRYELSTADEDNILRCLIQVCYIKILRCLIQSHTRYCDVSYRFAF